MKPVVGELKLFKEPTTVLIFCIRNENPQYDTVNYFLTNKITAHAISLLTNNKLAAYVPCVSDSSVQY
jgi:hypothetical protein